MALKLTKVILSKFSGCLLQHSRNMLVLHGFDIDIDPHRGEPMLSLCFRLRHASDYYGGEWTRIFSIGFNDQFLNQRKS